MNAKEVTEIEMEGIKEHLRNYACMPRREVSLFHVISIWRWLWNRWRPRQTI